MVEPLDMSCYAYYKACTAEYGEYYCQQHFGKRFTNTRILSDIDALAGYMRIELGLKPGDEVFCNASLASLPLHIERILSVDGVLGAYDLFLTDYGPDRLLGSVHVAVSEAMSARDVDTLTRRIEEQCVTSHGVILTAVGIYAQNAADTEASRIQQHVRRMVTAHEGVLQLHGFFVDKAEKKMRFDVVLDFALPSRADTYAQIQREVQEAYPDWQIQITLDSDISD